MTLPSIFGNFKDFDRLWVGFDDQLARMHEMHDMIAKNIPNYPPYNIKKVDENKYVIEMAVAGFAKSDIEVTMEDGKLIIEGKVKEDEEKADEQYLFQGLANRAFKRTFTLSDHIEIDNAEYLNGILKVALEKIIPEHKKPKKVTVK